MSQKNKGQQGVFKLVAKVKSDGFKYSVESTNISNKGILRILDDVRDELFKEMMKNDPCECNKCQISQAIKNMFN